MRHAISYSLATLIAVVLQVGKAQTDAHAEYGTGAGPGSTG
jgi:hypothetical protein